MTKVIHATKGYRLYVVGLIVFVLVFSALEIWLWADGHMPGYVAVISVVLLLCLIVRYLAVTRYPAVEIREDELIGYGWFGGKILNDLSAPIDMASTSSGIILKQGNSGAGIARHVIGKIRSDELIQLLNGLTQDAGD